MPISPWYINQTGEAITIYCRDDSSQPMPLLNPDGMPMNASQLTLLIKPTVGPEIAGGGLFEIVDAYVGIVKYQPASSDVASPGTVLIAVKVQTQSSGPIYSDRTTWDIQAR